MVSLCSLVTCLVLLLPGPVDDADDQARYIDGLSDRDLHELIVDEAQSFLADHARHDRSDLVRYRLGTALFELDRQSEARPHFADLAGRPNFSFRAEACLRLGQCELAAGRHREAAAALLTVLELPATYLHTPATFLLAEIDFSQQRWGDAMPRYARVLEEDPDGPYSHDATSALAWSSYRLGENLPTVELIEQLLRRDLDAELSRELQFLRGEALAALDRPSAALSAYEQVGTGPYADGALRGAGFAHAQRDDHRSAAHTFEQLVERFPASPFAAEAMFQLGVQRLAMNDASGAWEALSADIVADNAETDYWRANALAELGRDDEALATLDRASAASPGEELAGHIQVARGDLLVAGGRSAEAARAYAKGSSASALHAAAVTSLNSGDPEGALQLVDQLLAGGAAEPDLFLTRGEALFALERWGQAEAEFARSGSSTRAASRRAWCHYQLGDLGAAATVFSDLASQHPDAPEAEEALAMEGRCHSELGDTKQARAAWQLYLRRHPQGDHGAEALLGLSRGADDGERIVQLSALLDRHPESDQAPQALLELADALAATGQTAVAAQTYQQLLDGYPHHATTHAARYGLAWALVDLGRADDAVTALAPLLSEDPRRTGAASADPAAAHELHLAALELLVWCRHEQGRPDLAEQAWNALEALTPASERLLASARTVSAAWVAAGQPEKAQALLDQLANDGALAPAALVEATWVALDAGDLAAAQDTIGRALELAPDNRDAAEAAFFVAEAHFAAGDDARALPLYQAAASAAASPLPDKALYKAGFTALRADDPVAASRSFAQLVKDHPQSELAGEAMFLAGESAFRLDQFETAVPWLQLLLDEHPGHDVAPSCRFRLGLALCQLDRWSEAEKVLGDLARTAPDFANRNEAELWRGRALAQQGKSRPARAALQRVVADDQGVLAARARIAMGQLSLADGRTEEALSEFLKVAVLYAHDDEVAQALVLAGGCLTALGQTTQAAARYEEVLERYGHTPSAPAARNQLAAL